MAADSDHDALRTAFWTLTEEQIALLHPHLQYPAFVRQAFVDVVWMAYREGDQAVRHRAATVGLTLVALALGLGIALIDASPGWDDTGVSAAALFGVCVLLGDVGPRQPWMWAMAAGLWIPMLSVALHPSAPIMDQSWRWSSPLSARTPAWGCAGCSWESTTARRRETWRRSGRSPWLRQTLETDETDSYNLLMPQCGTTGG